MAASESETKEGCEVAVFVDKRKEEQGVSGVSRQMMVLER